MAKANIEVTVKVLFWVPLLLKLQCVALECFNWFCEKAFGVSFSEGEFITLTKSVSRKKKVTFYIYWITPTLK